MAVGNVQEGAAHAACAGNYSFFFQPQAGVRLADVIRITALAGPASTGVSPLAVSTSGSHLAVELATGWRRKPLQAWISDPAGFRP